MVKSSKWFRWQSWVLVCIALASLGILGVQVFRSPRKPHSPLGREAWDTPVSPAKETDVTELNKVKGETSPIPFEQVKEAVGVLEPAKLEDLAPRAKNIELYRVNVVHQRSGGYYPPDMWGTGPFLLVTRDKDFFLLTKSNFERLFGPIDDVQHAQKYLQIYDRIFGSRFSYLVTDGHVPFLEDRREIPEPTEKKSVRGGFEAKLIWLNPHHVRRFIRQILFLHTDGIVDEGSSKVIKEAGPGIYF